MVLPDLGFLVLHVTSATYTLRTAAALDGRGGLCRCARQNRPVQI
jgi:hypothetical protein